MRGGDVPVRPPAVAGRFYPADPEALTRLVESLVDAVEVSADEPTAAAYVVPHAGLHYSGPTAARVYARLARHAADIERVVLLGPAHYMPLTGCAVPSTTWWRTPLGDTPVDRLGVRGLAVAGLAVVDDRPHALEHSLEVQLPFLQRVLGSEVSLLPIVVGRSSVDSVAAVIRAVGPRAGTVVLASTDLSHYLPDAAARRQDARTAEAVLDLAPERIDVQDACGVYALRGLLGWARESGLAPVLLHLATSADTAGDATRVVGYSAFAFAG